MNNHAQSGNTYHFYPIAIGEKLKCCLCHIRLSFPYIRWQDFHKTVYFHKECFNKKVENE